MRHHHTIIGLIIVLIVVISLIFGKNPKWKRENVTYSFYPPILGPGQGNADGSVKYLGSFQTVDDVEIAATNFKYYVWFTPNAVRSIIGAPHATMAYVSNTLSGYPPTPSSGIAISGTRL